METPATPGSSIGQRQPSLAGMSEEQLSAVNAGLPENRRSIQTIRGNNVGWFNPQHEREFGTLGESMRGIPGEPTYESNARTKMLQDTLTSHENVARITGGLHNQGLADERKWAKEQLIEKQTATNSAKEALEAVEGGGSKTATPGGVQSSSPPKYQTEEEKAGWDEMLAQMDRKRKEEERYRLAQLGGVQRFGLEDY
jgi:hypothetical protein